MAEIIKVNENRALVYAVMCGYKLSYAFEAKWPW